MYTLSVLSVLEAYDKPFPTARLPACQIALVPTFAGLDKIIEPLAERDMSLVAASVISAPTLPLADKAMGFPSREYISTLPP